MKIRRENLNEQHRLAGYMATLLIKTLINDKFKKMVNFELDEEIQVRRCNIQ